MRSFLALLIASACGAVHAAEGMWTLDNLPRGALKDNYAFEPDEPTVNKLMRASVRLAGGCSGSFISGDGLVLTNNHCVVNCTGGLSSEKMDYVGQGYVAATRAAELRCPDMELNRLEKISDVTERMAKATQGLNGKAYQDAKNAEKSRIESECGKDDTLRCDVVDLYAGGVQNLYRYRRFQDVRLAFAPEFDIGFFGGDPDNFQFPRYNLDAALLRVYEDGKPARIKDWFPVSVAGIQPSDLTLVTGHPGSTDRLKTVAQLERQRDLDLLDRLMRYSELRGLLKRYAGEGAEQARQAQEDLPFVENTLKADFGEMRALQSPALMQRKRDDEMALRADASTEDAGAWDAIAGAQKTYARIQITYRYLERGEGFMSDYFSFAMALVRGAAERAKPNEARLREYQDARLPQLTQRLFSTAPIYPEYERLRLGWSLGKLRERLGPDDFLVRRILAKDTPDAVAARLVEGTRLGDVAERKRLWEGGAEAVTASQDPFMQLARAVDGAARTLRRQYDNEVEAVETRGAETLSRLRFQKFGTGVYPDATFTLRLSYGEVRGWDEGGKAVPPFTTLAGLYSRETGSPPFRLSEKWKAAKARVNLDTPFNFVSTNDIIGGNSGSPVLNRHAEVVGLIFDGNIHSLGGAYGYDETVNRSVAVDARAIVEALRVVYGAEFLVSEITRTSATSKKQ